MEEEEIRIREEAEDSSSSSRVSSSSSHSSSEAITRIRVVEGGLLMVVVEELPVALSHLCAMAVVPQGTFSATARTAPECGCGRGGSYSPDVNPQPLLGAGGPC